MQFTTFYTDSTDMHEQDSLNAADGFSYKNVYKKQILEIEIFACACLAVH